MGPGFEDWGKVGSHLYHDVRASFDFGEGSQVYLGVDNVFDNNTAVVDGPGYGINVTKNKERNRVTCGNRAEGAGKGLTNIDCS